MTPSADPRHAARRPRRRAVLGLLGSAGLAAAALAVAAATVTSAPNLPDLISEPPGDPTTHVYVDRDGERLLMRFDGYVTNRPGAPAELEIFADQPDAQGAMRVVRQRVGPDDAVVTHPSGRRPVVIFEVADGHRHYHLKNAGEYSLWTPDGRQQVALAQKTEVGFCLEDSKYLGGGLGARYSSGTNDFCLQSDPGQGPRGGPLVMGITPGWRDVYDAGLPYQWVDVSSTPPGRYELANQADPTDVIAESDESNNGHAFTPAVVPGFLPKGLDVGRVDPGRAARVTLQAEEFVSECFTRGDPEDRGYCDPGPLRFRITTAPQRGELRQGDRVIGAGDVLTAGELSYTANPGQRGGDVFHYEAFDAGEPGFPRVRPQAAVAIQVGAPVTTVAISGAQPSIVAGLSLQLSAIVTNGPSGVTWTASAGSITPDGLFTAPATAGTVTVRATSRDDPSAAAEVAIRVTTPQVQAPAPIGRGGGGGVTRSARQLLINQRISQAAVRRASGVERWLAAGVAARDLAGGGITARTLGPGIRTAPRPTPAATTAADPRPVAVAAPRRARGARVTLSGRQLLINQRVSQAAIRRLNGLRARLDGRLTGGDLRPGAVERGKLAAGLDVVAADLSVARPPASRTRVAAPGRRGTRALPLTAAQLRVNQRIAQAAVRRSNALVAELEAGLDGGHFADRSIVAANLAPGARS
ncbi:lysyl oxidase family protein [Miltoncostaea marina]|uniref:lysyl oxidase family protein n=1 Tax=Miltoncostaea marina TaxID=2843215 RepID=UPI001C3E6C70|nr:lysyl oxidase family protein [Miltoncostaea marina]